MALKVMRDKKKECNDTFKKFMNREKEVEQEIKDKKHQLKLSEVKVKKAENKYKVLTALKKA